MAIKIKKERFYLNYENLNILKTINSNRILLPTNIVYNYKHFFGKQNKKNYIGYTTKLIKNVKDKKEIISLSSNILYDEIDELINETRYLSKNRVQLVDIRNNNNIVFNGNIYFVDPGLYRYKKGSPYIELYTKNITSLVRFSAKIKMPRNFFILQVRL